MGGGFAKRQGDVGVVERSFGWWLLRSRWGLVRSSGWGMRSEGVRFFRCPGGGVLSCRALGIGCDK